MTKEQTNNWEEKFEYEFPYPEHERYTKCGCSSEEEHRFAQNWSADPDEVKQFISKTISQEKEKWTEEIKDYFTEQGIDTYCLPDLLNRLQNK